MDNISFIIERNTLYEQVARRLEDMILSDITQANNKLPSEQTLATGFGVSRPVIREALRILKERGMVAPRQGGGSYITKPDLANVRECMKRLFLAKQISFEDVYEARLSLELVIIHMAIQNVQPQDIKRLQEINLRMEVNGGDITERIKTDIEFHHQIACIAGNQILEIFLDSLNLLLPPMLKQALTLPGADQDGVNYHRRIIDCLEKGNTDSAEELLRQHLILSMRNFEWAKENSDENKS